MIKSKSVKTVSFILSSLLIFVIMFCLVVNMSKPVTIIVDGIEITTRTNSNTVGDVLSENDIVLEDGGMVFPSKLSKISGGETIIFDNPVPVILYLGNADPYEIMTTSETVGDFLKDHGVEFDEGDLVLPGFGTEIVPDLEISVTYVDVKIDYEQHEVEHETNIVYNDDVYEGSEVILREGKNGVRSVKREKRYENGVEVSNGVIYDIIEVEPISKIIEIGTKKREVLNIEGGDLHELVSNAYENGYKISFLGNEYSISHTKFVEATAFYNSGSNGNHTTATGNPTVYNPSGWSTIAVDPKVIPLGTRLYIEGYGFGIAHDTGGAIKGNIIDVFMPSRDAAYTWGRKKGVKIYILS